MGAEGDLLLTRQTRIFSSLDMTFLLFLLLLLLRRLLLLFLASSWTTDFNKQSTRSGPTLLGKFIGSSSETIGHATVLVHPSCTSKDFQFKFSVIRILELSVCRSSVASLPPSLARDVRPFRKNSFGWIIGRNLERIPSSLSCKRGINKHKNKWDCAQLIVERPHAATPCADLGHRYVRAPVVPLHTQGHSSTTTNCTIQPLARRYSSSTPQPTCWSPSA